MADLLAPLHDMTSVNARFHWTAAHDASFSAIIDAIVSSCELVHLDWSHPFTVVTDASNYAIAAVLFTGPPGAQRPYAFISRKLTAPERKLHTTEQEGLAIFWAVTEKFAPLLWSRPFFLHTDHANLTYMTVSGNARVRRWLTALSRFDFVLSHIKGETNIADAPSRVDPAARAVHPTVCALAVLSGSLHPDAATTSTADSPAPPAAPLSPARVPLTPCAQRQPTVLAVTRRAATAAPVPRPGPVATATPSPPASSPTPTPPYALPLLPHHHGRLWTYRSALPRRSTRHARAERERWTYRPRRLVMRGWVGGGWGCSPLRGTTAAGPLSSLLRPLSCVTLLCPSVMIIRPRATVALTALSSACTTRTSPGKS